MLVYEMYWYKKATFCVIPTKWHSGKEEVQRQWKEQWLPGITRKQRENRQSKKDFRGMNIFHAVLSQLVCALITLSKHTDGTTPTLNPNVNHGLQVIIMSQHRNSSAILERTTLLPDDDSAGGMGVTRESLPPSILRWTHAVNKNNIIIGKGWR